MPDPVVSTPATPVVTETPASPFAKTQDEKAPHALSKETNKPERVVYKTKPRTPLNPTTPVVAATVESKEEVKTEAADVKTADAKAEVKTDAKAEVKDTPLADTELATRTKKLIDSENKVVKQKQDLSKRENDIKAQSEKYIAVDKEFAAEPLDAVFKYVKDGETHLKAFAKKDPIAFMKRLGVTPDDYIAQVFGTDSGVKDPHPAKLEETKATPMSQEMKDLLEWKAKMETEKAETDKLSANNTASEYRASTASFLNSNRESYKLLLALYPDHNLAANEIVKVQVDNYNSLKKQYGEDRNIP